MHRETKYPHPFRVLFITLLMFLAVVVFCFELFFVFLRVFYVQWNLHRHRFGDINEVLHRECELIIS